MLPELLPGMLSYNKNPLEKAGYSYGKRKLKVYRYIGEIDPLFTTDLK
jgi:hypothetical protein